MPPTAAESPVTAKASAMKAIVAIQSPSEETPCPIRSVRNPPRFKTLPLISGTTPHAALLFRDDGGPAAHPRPLFIGYL